MFNPLIKQFLISFFLPFALKSIKEYVKTTDTKYDDGLLQVVQDSLIYLSSKDNNTITSDIANVVSSCHSLKCQKAK